MDDIKLFQFVDKYSKSIIEIKYMNTQDAIKYALENEYIFEVINDG